MATEFINTLKPSGGDFTLPTLWESATQCDMTTGAILVFSHGGITGSIPTDSVVTGQTSGASGTVVGAVTATQILIEGITGGPFSSGEVVQLSAGNSVTISDAGDSPIIVMEADAATYSDQNFTLQGSITDITNYMICRPAAGHEHKGVLWAGPIISSAQSFKEFCSIKQSNCQMIGWSADNQAADANSTCFNSSGTGSLTKDCIMLTGYRGFGSQHSTNVFENCISIGAVGEGFYQYATRGPTYKNCTAIDCNYGFYKAGTTGDQPTLINCVVYNSTTADYFQEGAGWNAASSNNASSDATAPGSNSVTSITSAVFKDYAGGNYRPAIADTVLKGAGTDLSLGTDIRGRPITYISIGAYDSDEYVNTLKLTGGDYALMSTWEAAEQRTLQDRMVLECYNDWGATGLDDLVAITGWTTDANNFITVKAPLAQSWRKFNSLKVGETGFSGFALNKSVNDNVLLVTQAYTVLDGLAVRNDSGLASAGGIRCVGADGHIIQNCLAYDHNASSGKVRLVQTLTSATTPSKVINCISYNTRIFFNVNSGGNVGGAYNCTVYRDVATSLDCFQNTNNARAMEVQNCLAIDPLGTGDCFSAGLDAAGSTNNASSDLTAPGSNPLTSLTSAVFKDAANMNLRPANDSSPIWGAGANIGLTEDVRSRPITYISIGAYDSDIYINTLKSTGGDYSLMSTWEAAEQRTLQDRMILECYVGTYAESAVITVAGWTGNTGSNNITIKAADGNHHNGAWGTGVVINVTENFSNAFSVSGGMPFRLLQGIEFNALATNNQGGVVVGNIAETRELLVSCAANTKDCYFVNSINYEAGSSGIPRPIVAGCVAKGGANGFNLVRYNTASKINNCTAIGANQGFAEGAGSGEANAEIVNCLAFGSINNDWNATFAGWGTVTNNASEDGTAPGTAAITGVVAADMKDYAGGNYRPVESGVLWGAGADVSLGTDVRGEAVRWISIGAYDSDSLYRFLKATATLPTEYTNPITFESTEQKDLTALGDKMVLECDSGTYSYDPELVFAGWVTSALYHVEIKPTAGAEHGGVRDAAGAVIFDCQGTLNGDNALAVDDYLHVHDIQLQHLTSFNTFGSGINNLTNVSGALMERLVIVGGARALLPSGYNTNVTPPSEVRNCMVFGGAYSLSSFEQVIFKNVTMTGTCDINIRAANARSDNTIFDNVYAATWVVNNTFPYGTFLNNASADGTAYATAGAVINVSTSDGVDFVSPSTDNYQPTATGKLAGAGVDLSADFLDDITGALR